MSTQHTTFLNYYERGPRLEFNTEPSMTQPDMTMSLEMLLKRHTRGLDVPIFEGTYNDQFVPDRDSLDLSEYESYAEMNQLAIDELEARAKLETAQAAEQKQKLSEEEDRKLSEKIDKLSKKEDKKQ